MAPRPDTAQIWTWLESLPDPEIPAISLVDLGVVREVLWEKETLKVALTPTYSGCPATSVIALDVERELRSRGVEKLIIEQRLSPPWTTAWISERGRRRLREYGIAPPVEGTAGCMTNSVDTRQGDSPQVACPLCRSHNTDCVSPFGSTPCKAQYRCNACLEPFDYFKCH